MQLLEEGVGADNPAAVMFQTRGTKTEQRDSNEIRATYRSTAVDSSVALICKYAVQQTRP